MALAFSSTRTAGVARVRTPAAHRSAVVVRSARTSLKATSDVEAVTPAEAGNLMKEGWTVLDVRPPGEVAKVGIDGAKVVTMYFPETKNDPASLIKRLATWSNGGWWVGATHMIPNENFLAEVNAQVPKDKGVVVACQNGMRSLAACTQLAKNGYGPVAFIEGGLDQAKVGDFPTIPPGKDPRYGGIGGLSEALGWTKVQEQNGEKAFLGGVNGVLTGVGVVLVLDLLSILVGYVDVLINGPKV